MHDSSSSQEIETEYMAWGAPESPAIAIRRRVMEGIAREVNRAFAAAPHGGDDCGGILLGSRTARQISVEDFEPVPPEADSAALEETLDWFRSGAQPRLAVLGFYRSHTQPEFGRTEDDGELMRRHFADAEDLILLVKPGGMDGAGSGGAADVWLCLHAHADAAFVPIPFPLAESTEVAPELEPREAAAVAETEAPPLRPDAPAAISWPPPRPRLLPEPERPKRRWLWYTALTALAVVGGALAYQWLHPSPGPAAKAPAAPAAESVATKPAPTPAESGAEDSPAPGTSDTAIQTLLERWARDLKRGDAQAAAACYAPLVSTYFDRHSVTRDAVRGRIRQTLARYGGFDSYRISDVRITPVSDGRAVATFRKSWRTSGRRKFAGEEQERMTLVRDQDAWRISSEQQEKIYWERKPR